MRPGPRGLVLLIFFIPVVLSLSELFNGRETGPGKGICSMYDLCDKPRRLNCAGYRKAPVLSDQATLKSIKEWCDIDVTKDYGGRACVSPDQWAVIVSGLKFAKPLLSPCPACWKNFLSLWCEMSVSPDQSLYVRVIEEETIDNDGLFAGALGQYFTSSLRRPFFDRETRGSGKSAVKALNYYITPILRKSFFEACANVSMGMTNKKVLDVMFSSEASRDPDVLFDMMGKNSSMRSPYLIKFPKPAPSNNTNTANLKAYGGAMAREQGSISWEAPIPNDVWPLNITMFPCDHPEYACVCVDCYKQCPLPADWISWAPAPCTIALPLFSSVDCWSFGIYIAYLLLVLVLIIVLFMKITFCSTASLRRVFDAENGGQLHGIAQSREVDDTVRPYDYPLENFISHAFYIQGKWVAENLFLVLMIALVFILFSICVLIGFQGLRVEKDPVKLWVGPNSESALQKKFYDEKFGPFYRVAQIIIRPVSSDHSGQSAVNEESISLVYDILDAVQAIETKNSIRLNDICYRPLGRECLVQSVAMIWPSRKSFESSSDWEEDFIQCMQSPTDCLDLEDKPGARRVPLMPELIVGGIPLKYAPLPPGAGGRPALLPIDSEQFIDARSLVITILLDTNRSALENHIEWERSFIDTLKSFERKYPEFEWAYSAESSVEWEINRETEANVPVVIISYLAMFIYVAVALGRRDRRAIFARSTLAFGGVFLVAVSILFSAAIFTLLGIKTTLIIAEVIPFLVLAVGVDNLFLLVQAYDSVELIDNTDVEDFSNQIKTKKGVAVSATVSERIAQTLRRSGPSILVTELAELLAFSIGCFVEMPAVATFSMYAALAIACDIVLQMTVFTAFLALDGQRMFEGRPDPVAGAAIYIWNRCSHYLMFAWNKFVVKQPVEIVSEQTDHTSASVAKPGPRWIENVFKKHIAPSLTQNRRVQMAILGLYSLLIFFSLLGSRRIQLGLEQRLAVPTDSYLIKYFDALEKDLLVGPPVFFVVRNIPKPVFQDVSLRQKLASRFYRDISPTRSIGTIVEVNKGQPGAFLATGISNWFDDFLSWGRECCSWNPQTRARCEHPDQPGCESCISPNIFKLKDIQLEDADFVQLLKYFLTEMPSAQCPFAGGAAYANQVVLDENISAFRAYLQPLRTQSDFIDSLKASRRIASLLTSALREDDNMEAEVFAFSPYFVFFDQYMDIIVVSVILCTICFLVVFAVTWAFLGSFAAALLSALSVGSTAISLFGIMGWWSIGLSAVSLVNIIIAMGISVEFSSNMVRAYITSDIPPVAKGKDNNDPLKTKMDARIVAIPSRIVRSMQMTSETGSSVFLGITLTKFIGISILYFSTSKIFEVFYFRMYVATVGLAAFHGLALLPVILSRIGPRVVLKASVHPQ